MAFEKIKNRIAKRIKKSTLFQDKFGFENGIDITNDKMVIYRKNYVIKNIIFVSNMMYTVIFFIVSIFEPSTSNWLLTILLFPVTMLVNHFLNKLINKGSDDSLSQTMAMYVASFYMFLSSVLVYVKLKFGQYESGTDGAKYLAECGYILIYYSLLICAFYQDKAMLKNIFVWVVVLITILHFTLTYTLVSDVSKSNDTIKFLSDFFSSSAFVDILIRTILLLLFMVVLYIYVSMSNFMQEERKKEQAKRREVQLDYTNSITNIFESTIKNETYTEDEIKEIDILCQMVSKLASLLSVEPSVIDEYVAYTRLCLENKIDYKINEELTEDQRFNLIRSQTELGLKLVERGELDRKSEEILRYVLDGSNDDDFIKKMRDSIKNQESQIILICEIYISMRSVRTYKKAYNHKNTMAYIEKSFKVYFDSLVYDRFQRFDTDFEAIFDEE